MKKKIEVCEIFAWFTKTSLPERKQLLELVLMSLKFEPCVNGEPLLHTVSRVHQHGRFILSYP